MTVARRSRTFFATMLAVLITLALLTSGCGVTAPPEEKELDEVSLTLEWAPNALHIFLVAGQEKGIFADEGIDLQLYFPADTEDSSRLAALGKTDFAFATTGVLISAVGGEDFPLLGVSEFEPVLPQGVQVLDESWTIADFEGKTFGIWEMAPEYICFEKMLGTAGLGLDDVVILDPGFNVVPPLLAGQLDGTSANIMYEQADCKRQSGGACPIFLYEDYGCAAQGVVLVTNKYWLEDNEDLTRRFIRAMHNSIKFAVENTDESLRLWIERYPEFELDREQEMWAMVRTTFVRPDTKEHGLGWWNEENIQFWADSYYEGGYISKQLDAKDIVTNNYLPDEPIVPSNIDELLTAQDALFHVE
jgi:putative hydroxymethylpyrimidine transport system substrate-binding protein